MGQLESGRPHSIIEPRVFKAITRWHRGAPKGTLRVPLGTGRAPDIPASAAADSRGPTLPHRDRGDGRTSSADQLQWLNDQRELVSPLGGELIEPQVLQQ